MKFPNPSQDLPEALCIHFKGCESASSVRIKTHISVFVTELDFGLYMSFNLFKA